MPTPKWTVLYNQYSQHGLYRRYAFFDDEAKAEVFYHEKNNARLVPTKRPFHESDRVHLGLS